MKFNVKDIVLIDDSYPDDDVYREAYIVYHGAVLGSVTQMKNGEYKYKTLFAFGSGKGHQVNDLTFEYFTLKAINVILAAATILENEGSLNR